MRGDCDRSMCARIAPTRGGPVSAESSECHAEKMRIQTALQYPNALHLSFPLQQQPLAWQGKRKAGFLPPNFSPGGQKCEKYAPLWRYFFPGANRSRGGRVPVGGCHNPIGKMRIAGKTFLGRAASWPSHRAEHQQRENRKGNAAHFGNRRGRGRGRGGKPEPDVAALAG